MKTAPTRAPARITRTLASLLVKPRYLSRYVSHNLIQSKAPLELELPIFSYAAIDFLESHLQRWMTAGEYGGTGPATMFLARRLESVTAVEDQFDRYLHVERYIQSCGLMNISLQLWPYDTFDLENFPRSNYVTALAQNRYDVVVIQNREMEFPLRPICFREAEAQIKLGGIIVMNDAAKYPEIMSEHCANKVESFRSVGPYSAEPVTTDLFFY